MRLSLVTSLLASASFLVVTSASAKSPQLGDLASSFELASAQIMSSRLLSGSSFFGQDDSSQQSQSSDATSFSDAASFSIGAVMDAITGSREATKAPKTLDPLHLTRSLGGGGTGEGGSPSSKSTSGSAKDDRVFAGGGMSMPAVSGNEARPVEGGSRGSTSAVPQELAIAMMPAPIEANVGHSNQSQSNEASPGSGATHASPELTSSSPSQSEGMGISGGSYGPEVPSLAGSSLGGDSQPTGSVHQTSLPVVVASNTTGANQEEGLIERLNARASSTTSGRESESLPVVVDSAHGRGSSQVNEDSGVPAAPDAPSEIPDAPSDEAPPAPAAPDDGAPAAPDAPSASSASANRANSAPLSLQQEIQNRKLRNARGQNTQQPASSNSSSSAPTNQANAGSASLLDQIKAARGNAGRARQQNSSQLPVRTQTNANARANSVRPNTVTQSNTTVQGRAPSLPATPESLEADIQRLIAVNAGLAQDITSLSSEATQLRAQSKDPSRLNSQITRTRKQIADNETTIRDKRSYKLRLVARIQAAQALLQPTAAQRSAAPVSANGAAVTQAQLQELELTQLRSNLPGAALILNRFNRQNQLRFNNAKIRLDPIRGAGNAVRQQSVNLVQWLGTLNEGQVADLHYLVSDTSLSESELFMRLSSKRVYDLINTRRAITTRLADEDAQRRQQQTSSNGTSSTPAVSASLDSQAQQRPLLRPSTTRPTANNTTPPTNPFGVVLRTTAVAPGSTNTSASLDPQPQQRSPLRPVAARSTANTTSAASANDISPFGARLTHVAQRGPVIAKPASAQSPLEAELERRRARSLQPGDNGAGDPLVP